MSLECGATSRRHGSFALFAHGMSVSTMLRQYPQMQAMCPSQVIGLVPLAPRRCPRVLPTSRCNHSSVVSEYCPNKLAGATN